VLLARRADTDIYIMATRRTDSPPDPAVAEAVATIRRLLVNRNDRYGAYRLRDRGKPEQRVGPYTAPWPRQLKDADRKGKNRPFLGEWQLRDHVELAPFPDSPIGVHAISERDTCKWVALDIDRHTDDIPPDATRAARDAITRFLRRRLQLACLVEDSGGGGWHIWVPFTGAAPAGDAFALATVARTVGEEAWLKHDEVPRIDRYPTSPSHTTGKAGLGGGWIRLPGRHHKRDHESSIRLKTRSVTGLLVWHAFSKAAEINKPAKWRAAMREARAIHAGQLRERKRKRARAKAGANGKARTRAARAEDRFALDGWSLDRLVSVPLRPGERRLRELRVVRTAITEGLSVSDAGDAIRTLYAKAAGKSADLAAPSSRAELLDDVPALVVRLAERADFRWATRDEAHAAQQQYLDRVANRERRGMAGWSLRSFENWLGAFYAFLRTRAEEGGYAFLATTMVTTSDPAKTGAYYLKQNGGARPGVALGRSPVKTAFGYYLRRNGKVVDKPNRVTGYIAWLHILATTPLDSQHRTGLRIVRPAERGRNGLPVILDCSALPLDEPTR
jgi:hypothetical protein